MKTFEDVAETLRRIRKDRQWSQAEMAATANLSRVTVARMETLATKDISLQAVLKMFDGAGYELKVVPKQKGKVDLVTSAEKKRAEAVRRYLAHIQPTQEASPLKLQFAYDWANPNMSDDVLIRKVLDKGRFHDLAVICKKYGLARVRELGGDKISASPSLKRSFANIEQGFVHAQANHPA